MAPTGRLQDGESPDSSVEQSVYVAEKEGGPGQKEGQEVFWLPQPSSALQPQPFSPELPLESLGFENERRELVRRQEEHPPSISSEDQNGDLSLGKRDRGTWDTGTVARNAPESPGAPSPPDAHTLRNTQRSHTHTHFWKPLGLLLFRPPPSPPPTPGRLPSPPLAPFPLPLSASQMPACDFQMRKSCAGLGAWRNSYTNFQM